MLPVELRGFSPVYGVIQEQRTPRAKNHTNGVGGWGGVVCVGRGHIIINFLDI